MENKIKTNLFWKERSQTTMYSKRILEDSMQNPVVFRKKIRSRQFKNLGLNIEWKTTQLSPLESLHINTL